MSDNVTVHSGIKKIAVTVLTQAVILALSLVSGFILPHYMGTEMYGYFQTYLFYLAYLNLFGFGFNDGIALLYGGYAYKDLPFKRLQSSMRVFFIYLIVLTCVLLFAVSFVPNIQMRIIYYVIVLSVPCICLQCIVLTVFLSVNRTGIYNVLNLLTKALAVISYLMLLIAGTTKSEPMMYADFGVRVLITIICVVLGREFLFGKGTDFKEGIREVVQKSKVGIKITLAVIASSFIPVAGRVIIEWNEPKEIYGIYSFAMQLLSIIIIFTSTAGTVVFPILKRLQQNCLSLYYEKFSFTCDSLIYIALFSYIPLVLIIRYFMNEYVPALCYLHILLAMCLPLGKMQLLVTAYYKALRLERAFLIANGVGAIIMLFSTFAAYLIFHSVLAVAVCTTVILTIWCILVEKFLLKKMLVKINLKYLAIQIIMMFTFILAGSFQNLGIFTAIYAGAVSIYFAANHKETVDMFKSFHK